MAAVPTPPFAKGDVVYMWNQETKACDKEGIVNDVLEEPVQMGDSEMPAGSVSATSKDGLTLWVRPEHAGSVLKRKDPPSVDTQESSEAETQAARRSLQVGDKVVATCDFETSSKSLSSWITSSLNGDKVTKGAQGTVKKVCASSGDATVAFEGSWPWHRGECVVPKERLCFLELQDVDGNRSAPLGLATPSASSTSPPFGFSVGDAVHVWSKEGDMWLEDAFIKDMLKESKSGGDADIPVGSLLVSFRSGGRDDQWVAPKQIRKEVRHATDGKQRVAPSASTLSEGPRYNVGDFSVGDHVHLFHLSRKEWIQDAVISVVMEEAKQVDTLELPVGTLVVACENGTESHTVMPALFDSMLRREEHFGWNEVDPTQQAQAPVDANVDDMVDLDVADEGIHQPPPSSTPTHMGPSGLPRHDFQPPSRANTGDQTPSGSPSGDAPGQGSPASPGAGDRFSLADTAGEDESSQQPPAPLHDSSLTDGQCAASSIGSSQAGAPPDPAPSTSADTQADAGQQTAADSHADTGQSAAADAGPDIGQPGGAAPQLDADQPAVPDAGQPDPLDSDVSPGSSPIGRQPRPSLFTTPTAAPPSPAAAAAKGGDSDGDGDCGDADDGSRKRAASPPPVVVKATPVAPMVKPPSGSSLAPPTASSGAGGTLTPTMPGSPAPPTGTSSPRPPPESLPTGPYDRAKQRVLIIGSGFGMELNPAQFQVVRDAGYQIHAVTTLPNPENPQFPVDRFLPTITKAIKEFDPHVVVSASKGGAYMTALWMSGQWRGPSVVINRHPTLIGFPKGLTIILCHGSNDEYYQYRREDLETLARSGSPNRVLLYFTGNSGVLGRGYTREGDRHNMASLLTYDCLPRLLDAAMCGGDPEISLMLSWSRFVTPERLEAEAWLGYNPRDLRKLWRSEEQKGMDEDVLFEVDPNSEEYRMVEVCFRAQPTVPRAYHDMNPGMWTHLTIHKIERVENGMQEDGNAEPYFRSLQRGIENQGLEFRPGLHTKWAFHGSSAVDDIVNNPISGFQPLMSGKRAAALWGPGTYFARDAKYVYDGGFCKILPDGGKVMLLCLLMTGIPCLGDPNHPGVLPVRHGRHRYNSSVDSLSNPEIYVTQNPGAAYPAYVITFS